MFIIGSVRDYVLSSLHSHSIEFIKLLTGQFFWFYALCLYVFSGFLDFEMFLSTLDKSSARNKEN